MGYNYTETVAESFTVRDNNEIAKNIIAILEKERLEKMMRYQTKEEKKILKELEDDRLTKEEREEKRRRLSEIAKEESWPFVY